MAEMKIPSDWKLKFAQEPIMGELRTHITVWSREANNELVVGFIGPVTQGDMGVLLLALSRKLME